MPSSTRSTTPTTPEAALSIWPVAVPTALTEPDNAANGLPVTVDWEIGIGAVGDSDAREMDTYFREVVDSLRESPGGAAPVRMHDLGDDAIYLNGWLYVKRRNRVFWVFATGPDAAVARSVTTQLAALVLPRIDRLPPPPSMGRPVPNPSATRAVIPPPPDRVEATAGDLGTGSATNAAAPMLRPATHKPGRYPRGHLRHVCLRVEGPVLVAVDDRGGEHRFPLDGGPAVPASIGVVFRPGLFRDVIYRGSVPACFVVLDNSRRLLIRDGQTSLWPADATRRFADAAGLRHLPYGPTPFTAGSGRRVVRLDTKARRPGFVVAAMVSLTVAVIVAGGMSGLPALLVFPLAMVGCVAGILYLVDRSLDMVRKDHVG